MSGVYWSNSSSGNEVSGAGYAIIGSTTAQYVLTPTEQPDHEPVETFWTPEPIHGYRAWTLRSDGTLMGLNGHHWTVGKQERAVCRAVFPNHAAPNWGHLCGYNAAKSHGYVYTGSSSDWVTGLAALTGVVHEYQDGYRAEFAEIVELYIGYRRPYSIEYALQHAHLLYKVPIYEVNPANPQQRRILYGNG